LLKKDYCEAVLGGTKDNLIEGERAVAAMCLAAAGRVILEAPLEN
jgi:hypothetical protein